MSIREVAAAGQVEGAWCLTETCLHRAPAPGSRCPTCQEENTI
jgi:hypothetical protein